MYGFLRNLLMDKTGGITFQCFDAWHIGFIVLFGVAAVLIVPFVNLYTHGVTDVNYDVPVLGILIILEALAEKPYKDVAALIRKIVEQTSTNQNETT